MINLKKIESVGGIEPFSDFSWDASEARKYNLVYGWNASGKTTLSRIFRFLELREIDSEEFESVTFRLDTEDGIVREDGIPDHDLEVRVFNEDFVDDNLSFDESSAEPIVILGKDNVELEEEIDELKEQRADKVQEEAELESRLEEVPDVSNILTECARSVVKEFQDAPLAPENYEGRRYNRRQVEAILSREKLTSENVHSHIVEESEKLSSLREQLTEKRSEVEYNLPKLEGLEALFEEANEILQYDVETATIGRLERDDELRAWVESGLRLHKERDEVECLFCGNEITEALLDKYSGYFTEEVEEANEWLNDVHGRLAAVMRTLSDANPPDSNVLFPDLRDQYMEKKARLSSTVEELIGTCKEVMERLDERRGRIQVADSTQEPVPYPETKVEAFQVDRREIGQVCEEHNSRLEVREDRARDAAAELELHTIASFLTDADYFKNKNRTESLTESLGEVRDEISEVESAIQEKQAGLRDAALAVEEINGVLTDFVGEGEIELKVEEGEDEDNGVGYRVTSHGEEIRHLSDGEESIVALAYFLVSLRQEETNLENAIVVVDDPVDSQDSAFLYRTFGLLKNHLSKAGQVFLFTHNYDLFNLMRDWLTSDRFSGESELYHIEMTRGKDRKVTIDELPELLRKYRTEYQYLFARLYRYNNNPELEEGPVVANIARKVLEHFGAFKWSCSRAEDFTSTVHNRFVREDNPHKKAVADAVVRFVHQYSHGEQFDRSVTASVMEAEDICDKVLEFIRLADKEHYKAIVKDIEDA